MGNRNRLIIPPGVGSTDRLVEEGSGRPEVALAVGSEVDSEAEWAEVGEGLGGVWAEVGVDSEEEDQVKAPLHHLILYRKSTSGTRVPRVLFPVVGMTDLTRGFFFPFV